MAGGLVLMLLSMVAVTLLELWVRASSSWNTSKENYRQLVLSFSYGRYAAVASLYKLQEVNSSHGIFYMHQHMG